MESGITLFTAHGKVKVQLSHVLQTELPTIQRDSQLYTFPQYRRLRNSFHSSISNMIEVDKVSFKRYN